MENIRLNVKNESVRTFLEGKVIGYKEDKDEGRNRCGSISAYNLLRDEMFFKIDCGIKIKDLIRIQLFDESRNTSKELVNTYIYEAVKYDDVSIKMVLVDFNVKLK